MPYHSSLVLKKQYKPVRLKYLPSTTRCNNTFTKLFSQLEKSLTRREQNLNHYYHPTERNQTAMVMACSCKEPGVHTIIIKSDSIYGQLTLSIVRIKKHSWKSHWQFVSLAIIILGWSCAQMHTQILAQNCWFSAKSILTQYMLH